MEIFWKTIGLYNAATWEWQLGIILIGIILTVLLTRNPQPWVKNGMKIYLIAVYLWISVIYYNMLIFLEKNNRSPMVKTTTEQGMIGEVISGKVSPRAIDISG